MDEQYDFNDVKIAIPNGCIILAMPFWLEQCKISQLRKVIKIMEEFIYIFDPDTRSIESNLLTMYDCINWMLEHDCRYNATELKRLKKLQEIIKKEEEKLK